MEPASPSHRGSPPGIEVALGKGSRTRDDAPRCVRGTVFRVDARAHIWLAPTAEGGLQGAMPSPCRSLLLRTEPGGDAESLVFGVRIAVSSGDSLRPGTEDPAALLWFWATEEAAEAIAVGTSFSLLYPSRVVGNGIVEAVLDG